MMLPTKFHVNWSFSSGEEAKDRFKHGGHLGFPIQTIIDFQGGRHLGFLIGRILAIFDLQVSLMLPTKFQVNWLLGSGEEAKK